MLRAEVRISANFVFDRLPTHDGDRNVLCPDLFRLLKAGVELLIDPIEPLRDPGRGLSRGAVAPGRVGRRLGEVVHRLSRSGEFSLQIDVGVDVGVDQRMRETPRPVNWTVGIP